MHIILLSGGAGQRLWPLSSGVRSKQFLKLLDEGNNAQKKSMLQRVWGQLKDANLTPFCYISANRTQGEMIRRHIDEQIVLIEEPEQRDTFPAVALSSSYLISKKGIDPNEVVIVLPTDLYIEKEFIETIKKLEKVIEETGANLAMIGTQPTTPSTKFGYIKPGKELLDCIFKVNSFHEKPDETTATELINESALWNCGIYAFRLRYIKSQLEYRGFKANYENLRLNYSTLPKKSIDYEIIEKETNSVVVRYDGMWRDLGTWSELSNMLNYSTSGQVITYGNTLNTTVINELDIPVAVIGIQNLIVAASPSGILVSDKNQSHHLKNLPGLFQASQEPNCEEKQTRTIDFSKKNGFEILTRRVCIQYGSNISYHSHQEREETWIIIEGEGEVVIDGLFWYVSQGDVIKIPKLSLHSIRAITTELMFIELQKGRVVTQDDTTEHCTQWEHIKDFIRI
ncbi:sugar phosphate nucleotidyltransferase [Paenibacillus cellulositrophicus]|uniref:sugar phosphate nucleotidyltransferase n=1 Tax=Paenibacillus cellulositrophicus TaxID=562959 RepID=UPI002040A4BF|nr:sugar phosphate nucleotidyltransferase [Paenibacillus cellulositrophicus]MCM2996921.1 sugar phosphate nucleotidyltransferase [Paenibacillus cellulositrophicus]